MLDHLHVWKETETRMQVEINTWPTTHLCLQWHHKGLFTRNVPFSAHLRKRWCNKEVNGIWKTRFVHLGNAADLILLLAKGWRSEQQRHLFTELPVYSAAQHLCTHCMTKSSFWLQLGVFGRGCQATGGTWNVDRANNLLLRRTSAHPCWQNALILQNQSQFHRPCWKRQHLWHERSLELGFNFEDQLNPFRFCCYADCSAAVKILRGNWLTGESKIAFLQTLAIQAQNDWLIYWQSLDEFESKCARFSGRLTSCRSIHVLFWCLTHARWAVLSVRHDKTWSRASRWLGNMSTLLYSNVFLYYQQMNSHYSCKCFKVSL